MKRKYNFSAGPAGLALISVVKDLLGKAFLATKVYRAIAKPVLYANVDALRNFTSAFERRCG